MQAAVRSLSHSPRWSRRPPRTPSLLLLQRRLLTISHCAAPPFRSRTFPALVSSPRSVLSSSVANCCACLPRRPSNFPILSSAARRQLLHSSNSSALAKLRQAEIKLVPQAITKIDRSSFTSKASSRIFNFKGSVPNSEKQLLHFQRRSPACRLNFYSTTPNLSPLGTSPLRTAETSSSVSDLRASFYTSHITPAPPRSSSFSFSQKQPFNNRYYSTQRRFQSSNSRKSSIYAGTSVSLLLFGIYSVSDTSSPVYTLSSLSDVNIRSLTDWWSPSPEASAHPPASSAPPRNITPRNHILTNDMASTIPGRPETLTAEQEAKLKEFWNATLKLFGQSATEIDDEAVEESTPATSEADPQLTRADSELKKKRKFFSRSKKDKEKKDKDKNKDSDKDSVASSAAPTPPSGINIDPEDKYNQGKDFKAALASQTPEQLRATFWGFVKYDNPDGLLLRFLRARKWDVEKALVMMVSTMHWRGQEVLVEDIVRQGELHAVENDNEGFMKQLRIGKSYIHGVDKENRPVCIVSARLHKAADQSEESLERYTVYLIETTRLLLKQPVDTACILFDMSGFGLANMDYGPVKFMIKCFEAHYPECLGVCLVHKAPWVFQGIWRIIKGWLDPVVASKVHFTSDLNDLSKFINKSQIPKALEGDEDWEYKYVEPVPGENAIMASTKPELIEEKKKLEEDRWKIIEEYEKNTRDWINEESKGASVETPVKDERGALREQLRTNYWGLDKFVRAKTYYDRVGMIGKNGDVDFYPWNKEEKINGNGNAVPAHTSDEDID